MTNQHFNYTLEPLESFIFTLSEDISHQNIFSGYPQETKRLSLKNKIINHCLEFKFLNRNKKSSLFFFILGVIRYL